MPHQAYLSSISSVAGSRWWNQPLTPGSSWQRLYMTCKSRIGTKQHDESSRRGGRCSIRDVALPLQMGMALVSYNSYCVSRLIIMNDEVPSQVQCLDGRGREEYKFASSHSWHFELGDDLRSQQK